MEKGTSPSEAIEAAEKALLSAKNVMGRGLKENVATEVLAKPEIEGDRLASNATYNSLSPIGIEPGKGGSATANVNVKNDVKIQNGGNSKTVPTLPFPKLNFSNNVKLQVPGGFEGVRLAGVRSANAASSAFQNGINALLKRVPSLTALSGETVRTGQRELASKQGSLSGVSPRELYEDQAPSLIHSIALMALGSFLAFILIQLFRFLPAFGIFGAAKQRARERETAHRTSRRI